MEEGRLARQMQMRPADGREIAAGNDYQIDKDFAAIAEEIDGSSAVERRQARPSAEPAASAKFDLSALPPTGGIFSDAKMSCRARRRLGGRIRPTSSAWLRGAAPANRHSSTVGSATWRREISVAPTGSMAGRSTARAPKRPRHRPTSSSRRRSRWFGDPAPERGSPWQKGERLAGLIQKQRTLLVLDGLEPLQNPPGRRGRQAQGPGAGRAAPPSRQAQSGPLSDHHPRSRSPTSPISGRRRARHRSWPAIDRRPAAPCCKRSGVRGEPEELAAGVDAVRRPRSHAQPARHLYPRHPGPRCSPLARGGPP